MGDTLGYGDGITGEGLSVSFEQALVACRGSTAKNGTVRVGPGSASTLTYTPDAEFQRHATHPQAAFDFGSLASSPPIRHSSTQSKPLLVQPFLGGKYGCPPSLAIPSDRSLPSGTWIDLSIPPDSVRARGRDLSTSSCLSPSASRQPWKQFACPYFRSHGFEGCL